LETVRSATNTTTTTTTPTTAAGCSRVVDHYSTRRVKEALLAGLEAAGKSPETVTPKDLAPCDEFHVGGVPAAEHLFGQLNIAPSHTVLDVGCGLGGPARLLASTKGCRVLGVDICAEFVHVGGSINTWPLVGLSGRVRLATGDALKLRRSTASLSASAASDRNLAVEKESMDAAYLLHVGQNIGNKEALARELFRVLRPGGRVGVFDPTAVQGHAGPAALIYPLPFASGPGHVALATPDEYRAAFEGAGFALVASEDRTAFGVKALEVQRATVAEHAKAHAAPPPLSLAVVMGPTLRDKVSNLLGLLKAGGLGLTEMVWEKPQDENEATRRRQRARDDDGAFDLG